MLRLSFVALVLTSSAALASPLSDGGSFVNWESPHVHPLELIEKASGETLLVAVNTADDRIEVFDADGAALVHLFDVPVGLDPVSVRARTESEVWVVNHVSDSISIVNLDTRNVVRTLLTDFDRGDDFFDVEPADVVFAGTPERAFVSCTVTHTVLVYDTASLGTDPIRVELDGEQPKAMAVNAAGDEVYVAVFESGNGSTVLGGGSLIGGGFPPNVVNDPTGPYGGQNPPPNSGGSFDPPQKPGNPAPPAVGLVVKKDAAGRWMDDNGGDWTDLVSGPNAAASGRQPGWDLPDNDVAIVDASSLSVSYSRSIMNHNAALAVHPGGELVVVGTDGTNEVRFEPNLQGRFIRVSLARVDPAGPTTLGIVDLNPHLDYLVPTVPQAVRDRTLADPRGVAWNQAGSRGYVTGMGSNNVVVVDATGARVGLTDTVEVGEGPSGGGGGAPGGVVPPPAGRLYVMNKFESSISTVDLATEAEVARVTFFDPSPVAIQIGRRHLYDAHETSGLGLTSCQSCHTDGRMDRLSWDLGDPGGDVKPFSGNCPTGGCQDWHPMKGPMLTQTLRDIIGKEPHHWRGDRAGIEEFNPAFQGLLGDDEQLTAQEMQEFEDFLETIHFPPNPYRNLDNTLPNDLDLTGHFTTGRFAPAGLPLPRGDAVNGLALYRPPSLLDGSACVTCHTLPTGLGADFENVGGVLVPIPPGPNGERHHALVSVDGSTNITMKIPHLRNLYERVGFEATQLENRAGFGLLHDGSVDSIARFVSEPVFSVQSDQQVADLTAFMLAFSGSDLPEGSPSTPIEPPGSASHDTHAAVGEQVTLVDEATAPAGDLSLIAQMIALADASAVGLVVKGKQGGLQRGYAYVGSGTFQSDRLAETHSTAALQAAAAPGSELTYLVVPLGSETRIGVDRDEDGALDRDELDAGTDPADPTSVPGCTDPVPAAPTGLTATPVGTDRIDLAWSDNSTVEDGYRVERAPAGSGSFVVIATLAADATSHSDTGLACGTSFDYRVSAFNCAGSSGFSTATGTTGACPATPVHVESIDMTLTSSKGKKMGNALVTILDDQGNPVAGATVDGTWSGSAPGSGSQTTNAAGQALFVSDGVKGKPSQLCFTFTVDDVSGAGLVYDSAANVETSDSVGGGCP